VLQTVGGCLPTQSLLIPIAGLVAKPGWTEDQTALQFFDIAGNGGKLFKGPLLVLASEQDSTLAYQFVDRAVNDTGALASNKKESLEFKTYHGLDHFSLIQWSRNAWLEWVKARFEHKDVGVAAGVKRENIVALGVNATMLVSIGGHALSPSQATSQEH
jgi:hypothetical protein